MCRFRWAVLKRVQNKTKTNYYPPKTFVYLGEDKLICCPKGPTNPILSKTKKQHYKILVNWHFLICCFLLFETNEEIKPSKLIYIYIYINNQNQEAFIVITINYKLRIFLFFPVCYAKYYFSKNTDTKNQIILFLFCRPSDPIFCLFVCLCLARRPKN